MINGKPSVLTSEGGNALGSITAEMIEKVEVITNPSAKYEAEGINGSGNICFINIVIQKKMKETPSWDINGSFTFNYGQPKGQQ